MEIMKDVRKTSRGAIVPGVCLLSQTDENSSDDFLVAKPRLFSLNF